jgi:hypothetical protein
MNDRARERDFSQAAADAQGERASLEQYLRSRSQARDAGADREYRPGPLEFDESGFPIAPRGATTRSE